jgi:hypothetical protein
MLLDKENTKIQSNASPLGEKKDEGMKYTTSLNLSQRRDLAEYVF